MLLLVGLGNPGPKYEKIATISGLWRWTRLSAAIPSIAWRGRFQAQTAEGRLGGEKFGDEADHFYERVRTRRRRGCSVSNSMQPTSLFCMTNWISPSARSASNKAAVTLVTTGYAASTPISAKISHGCGSVSAIPAIKPGSTGMFFPTSRKRKGRFAKMGRRNRECRRYAGRS